MDLHSLDVVTIVLLYGVLLVSLVFHEAAHALFALLGGDRTAYLGGQVSLNPIPHIKREPFGTVILPLAALIMTNGGMCFGYAHAPYDPLWAYRHPRRAALMSAAGPLANLTLALAAFVVLKLLVVTDLAETVHGRMSPWMMLDPVDGTSGPVTGAIRMASAFLLLNVFLAILNLMPIPPFDGAGVVEGVYPKSRGVYEMMRGQILVVLVALYVIWQVLPEKVLFPVMREITGWL